MLEAEGHPTDKIELRIIGGTWSYYPKLYQTWFIKRCFDATNRNKKISSNKRKIKAMAIILRYLENAQKIKEAEKIAKKEFGLNKIAVISGIGARSYFKKLGFKIKDTYYG